MAWLVKHLTLDSLDLSSGLDLRGHAQHGASLKKLINEIRS